MLPIFPIRKGKTLADYIHKKKKHWKSKSQTSNKTLKIFNFTYSASFFMREKKNNTFTNVAMYVNNCMEGLQCSKWTIKKHCTVYWSRSFHIHLANIHPICRYYHNKSSSSWICENSTRFKDYECISIGAIKRSTPSIQSNVFPIAWTANIASVYPLFPPSLAPTLDNLVPHDE